MLYNHTSTLDGFMLNALPALTASIAKSELLLIPFYSWLYVATGGKSISRKNREQAIKELKVVCDNIRHNECIVMAPEGTRSKKGLLLPFKKGPFHLWEQMNRPILPIVIFGASELLPLNRSMSMPGKVFLRFCPMIVGNPDQVTRAEMMRRVRKAMLLEYRNPPSDAAAEVSSFYFVKHIAYLIATYGFMFLCYRYIPAKSILSQRLSVLLPYFYNAEVSGGILLAISVGSITSALYLYEMVFAPNFHSRKSSSFMTGKVKES